MDITPAFAAAILAAAPVLTDGISFGSGSVSLATFKAGREHNVVVTASRTTIYACRQVGREDGYEVLRAYGAPEVSLLTALGRLAA